MDILSTISALPGRAWDWLSNGARRLVRDSMTAATGHNRKPQWPPECELPRLRRYADAAALYAGRQQKFYERRGFRQENPDRPYICANLLALLTDLISSRLYGEGYTVDAPTDDDATQQYLEHLDRSNSLQAAALLESIDGSGRGDRAWRVAYEGGERKRVVVQRLHPGKVFPEWDDLDAAKMISCNVDQLVRVDAKRVYLWRERHELRGGQSWVVNKLFRLEQGQDDQTWHFDPQDDEVPLETLPSMAGMAPETPTGIDALLVVYAPGDSDYTEDLLSLQGQYNHLLTQKSDLFDKHLPALMTGPIPAENALGYDGTIKLGQMRYVASAEGVDTTPITLQEWQAAGFGAADAHLDRIKSDFVATAGVDFTALFPDASGAAQSGAALRRQQMKTQATVALRQVDHTPMLRSVYSICCKLAATYPLAWRPESGGAVTPLEPEQLTVTWSDGLPADALEDLEIQERRLAAGVQSKHDAIKLLDGLSDEDAAAKLQEIQGESSAASSASLMQPGLFAGQRSPSFAGALSAQSAQAAPPQQE